MAAQRPGIVLQTLKAESHTYYKIFDKVDTRG